MCRREILLFSALLLVAAAMFLWNLSANGWANAYYAAAAQAGAYEWKAFLFGSLDTGNSITLDKLPASVWISSLSFRIFGVSPWSLLVPQALMGVGTIALTYLTVRRHFRMTAAMLAAVITLLTPAAATLFRYNNPDALLTLLLSLSLYLVVRAIEDGRWRWLVGAGIVIGLGFLAKSAQALVIIPVFATVYFFVGPGKPLRRGFQFLAALAATTVSAGWWILLAENWDPAERPYAGGSFSNSFVEVLLRQNGLGRLLGTVAGGAAQAESVKPGPFKLFVYPTFGTQGSWLLPAAIILLTAALVLLRKRPREDPKRALLLLAGGWLLAYAGVFSFMAGVINPYYMVALAPPLGIVIGAGAQLSWTARRWLPFRLMHGAAVAVTALLAAGYMFSTTDINPGLLLALLIIGLILAEFMVLRLPKRAAVRTTAIAAAVICLMAPTSFTLASVVNPHNGVWPAASLGRLGPLYDSPSEAEWPSNLPLALRGTGIGHSPEKAVVDILAAEDSNRRWAAATPGAMNAAQYQLASNAPVMPVGGFNGSSPFPTSAQFAEYVQSGQVRYFILRRDSQDIDAEGHFADAVTAWVKKHFEPRVIGDIELYDLQNR